MIDLSKTHNLHSVADLWWRYLHSFLFDEREGVKKPYYYNGRHKRKPCTSFYEKMCKKVLFGLSQSEKKEVSSFLEFFKENCKAITMAGDNELRRFAIEYRVFLRGFVIKERKKVNDKIVGVFSDLYESFIKEHGYEVLSFLNIKTCPFCNRQFVTVCKGAHVRPDIDHYYPKSVFPILAVSFFNLVPICSTCNKIKRDRRILNHPFFGGANLTFIVHKKGDKTNKSLANLSILTKEQIEVSVRTPDIACKRSLNVLRTKAIYNTHRDYVTNIILKAFAYDRHACDALVRDFAANGESPQDVYNFAWGPYLDLKHQEEMPLSKFTADILDEFGIK